MSAHGAGLAEANPAGLSSAALARYAVPVLLLASGACGVPYAVLYARLLGNLLGNPFAIHATLVLTFLLGLALGSLHAHRWRRWLWLIEGGIGLYALALALGYPWIDALLYAFAPGLLAGAGASAATAWVLLLVPALLLGCSLPLLAALPAGCGHRNAFPLAYGIYGAGAALSVLAAELVLIRTLGLQGTIAVLALLNGLVAATLLALEHRRGLTPARARAVTRFPGRVAGALAIASVASAVFQLLAVKVVESVLGPFNETFAVVSATALIGLAIGAAACSRLGLTFGGALLTALYGVAWILALFPIAATVYAGIYPQLPDHPALRILLELGFVLVLMGPAAAGFGATLPALLQRCEDLARQSGQLLFCSAAASAVGFLLMAFILHPYLDYGVMLLVVAALAVAATLVHADRMAVTAWSSAGVLGIAALTLLGFWDEQLLYAGHQSFHSAAALQAKREDGFRADRFKGPQDVLAVTWSHGEPYLFTNGYLSRALSSDREKYLGALSSMLAPRTGNALVLGMGSGATAATVGLVFDRTDVVEIHRLAPQHLRRLAQYNFDITRRPRIELIRDDAMHYVKTSRKRYSLIVNTAPSPRYSRSSKLYTQEFLRQVRERLGPGGVYVTGFGRRGGGRGLDIMLNTLSSVFKTCWMYYLGRDDLVLACGAGPLGLPRFGAVSRNLELRRDFANRFSLPLRLLPYSIISTDALRLRSTTDVPVNTLDLPALEFQRARPGAGLPKTAERLQRELDLPALEAALAPSMHWRRAEFVLFASLRLPADSPMGRILGSGSAAMLDGADDPIDEAALRLGDEVGTAGAFYRFGKTLRKLGRAAGAVRVLARAVGKDPGLDQGYYELGQAYFALEQYDRALRNLLVSWEPDRKREVALLIARALLRLERPDQALEWLDKAARSGGDGNAAVIAYYQGVAHESLSDLPRAARSYAQALRLQRDFEPARDAMARLRGPRPAVAN